MQNQTWISWICLGFVAAFGLHTAASALTIVDGPIASDTVWTPQQGPYRITNDIELRQGVTLTIEAGTIVEIDAAKTFTINGRLVAIGTEESPITFTRAGSDPWGQLYFTDFSDDGVVDDDLNYAGGSVLQHCIIEYGRGIFCRFGGPLIAKCTIRNNVSSGIRVEHAGLVIVDNLIYGNSTELDPAAGNGAGIIVYTDKPTTIVRNIVRDNRSIDGRYGGGGICAYADGDISVVVAENSVYNNYSSTHSGGIFAYNSTVRGNWVVGNRCEQRGGGINVIECEVTGNLVDSNQGNGGGGIYAENSTLSRNSIVRNRSGTSYGGGIYFFGSGAIRHNTIMHNLSDDPSQSAGIYVSGDPALSYNTIYANRGYGLYTGNPTRSPLLDARNNFWGPVGVTGINASLYDWFDDSERGLVDYADPLEAADPQAPPPPPAALTAAERPKSSLGGPILTDTTWALVDSPYTLNENALVSDGVTLTIEPGVTVNLGPDVSFMVRGKLVAIGSAEKPITFTKGTDAAWGTFIFADASVDAVFDEDGGFLGGSILKHCVLEHGKGLLIEAASPFVADSDIRNHEASGITIRKGGPTIAGNRISGNRSDREGGGIYVYTNDVVRIRGNVIEGNRANADGGGIFAYGYRSTTAITIEANTISNNEAQGNGGGIYASRATIAGNSFKGNVAADGGGGAYTTFSILDRNTFEANSADEGGGIYAERNSTITYNKVRENTASSPHGGGVYINFWGRSVENEEFSFNEVTGNRAASSDANGGVFVTGVLIFEKNNIFGNTGYALYNANPADMDPLEAKECYWGAPDREGVEKAIFHNPDDEGLAVVAYEPFALEKREDL